MSRELELMIMESIMEMCGKKHNDKEVLEEEEIDTDELGKDSEHYVAEPTLNEDASPEEYQNKQRTMGATKVPDSAKKAAMGVDTGLVKIEKGDSPDANVSTEGGADGAGLDEVKLDGCDERINPVEDEVMSNCKKATAGTKGDHLVVGTGGSGLSEAFLKKIDSMIEEEFSNVIKEMNLEEGWKEIFFKRQEPKLRTLQPDKKVFKPSGSKPRAAAKKPIDVGLEKARYSGEKVPVKAQQRVKSEAPPETGKRRAIKKEGELEEKNIIKNPEYEEEALRADPYFNKSETDKKRIEKDKRQEREGE